MNVKCVDNLSQTAGRHVPLEYSEDLEYSLLLHLLCWKEQPSRLFVWYISIDVHVPTWASNLNNPTRTPYPWNIFEQLQTVPRWTNAMAALSALAAGMINFQELLSRSLIVPTASKYLTDLIIFLFRPQVVRTIRPQSIHLGRFVSVRLDGSNEDDEDRLSDKFGSTSDADDDDLRFLQNGLIESFVLEKYRIGAKP